MQTSKVIREVLGSKLRDRRSSWSPTMNKRMYDWRSGAQVPRQVRICLIISACSSFLSTLTYPNVALASNNFECQSQITYVKNKIQAYGGKVAKMMQVNATNSPFNNADSEVTFVFGQFAMGKRMGYISDATKSQDLKNLALMNSSLVLKSYAARLIRECQNVVRVGFGYGEWSIYFSIHPNAARDIREDTCTNTSPATSGLPWGEQYCL